MRINVAPAFERPFKGITIFEREDGIYQVSLRVEDGWRIGYGDTPQDGLDDALEKAAHKRKRDDDLI